MSPLDAFHAAGYAVVPARGGRLAASGFQVGRYHYTPGSERFADFDVGIVCASMPIPGAIGRGDSQVVAPSNASGAGRLDAIASTWCAAIRWRSHLAVIREEIAGIVDDSPSVVDGDTTIRLYRVDAPINTRKMQPQHFAAEKFRAFDYVPHSFEILSRGAWLVLPHGAKPIPRADLPLLTDSRAAEIMSTVETAFIQRNSQPWI